DKPVRQPAPRPEPGRMAGPMPEDLGGAWVGGLLFSLILAMTLLMLVYLFVQPFYPILPL
ncbi:MAG TPA: hypothetical protein PKC45_15255, partial [Gemmatales bacterium]|nr:hypothetical protein [Gemmatales bacterium]